MIKTTPIILFLSLSALSLSTLAGPLNGDPNRIIDPPRNAYEIQDPSEGVYGYPPGAPIQKMEQQGDDNEGFGNGRVIIDEGVYGYPPGAPIQPTIQAEEPTKPTYDSPPPVRGVLGVRRAAEVLANLDPRIQLEVQQTTLLAGTALTLAAITRAFIVARTRNPQMAYAMIPPVTLSNGEGTYTVPAHGAYSLEDIQTLAEYLAGMEEEEAALKIEELEPELLNYMEEVAAAVSMAAYEDYVRSCPNPDLCA